MVVYDLYRGIGVIDKALCYLWKTFFADKVVKAQAITTREQFSERNKVCANVSEGILTVN